MHGAVLSEQRLQPQPSKPSEASLIARGLALVYDPTLEAETKQRQPKPDQALRIASSPFNADMSDMRCAAALLPCTLKCSEKYLQAVKFLNESCSLPYPGVCSTSCNSLVHSLAPCSSAERRLMSCVSLLNQF
jgi:hypothetical protein